MANFDDILDNRVPDEQGKPPFSKEEYAARKKDEREELYARLDDTALSVAADPAMFTHYLGLQSRLGRYTAVNALLVFSKNPNAAQVGDLNYWRGQKIFIRKDELKNPIQILEPGDQYRREDGSVGTFYNIKNVYDISQAERKILPPQTPGFTERQLLQALVSKAPVKITGVDELPDGGGARTDPDTGEIQVLKGMEFPDTFRSVTHELCHAEAVRDENTVDPQFTAYCASYVLCKKYGVDTKDYQFDSASHMFEGMDAQAVKHELSQIRAAADAISGRMAKQLERAADTPNRAAKSRDEAR
jgi:hypothetical protein